MLWENFLTLISNAFGIGNLSVTALIVSLIITAGTLIVIALTTRSQIGTIFTGFILLFLFTACGWVDVWVLLVTVLGIAGVYALMVKNLYG
jgi:hypothetical protein